MYRQSQYAIFLPFLLVILLLAASSFALFKDIFTKSIPITSGPDSLKVVTLIYSQTTEHRYIEHNCMRISRTRHHFIIFTDDLSQPYCSKCECRLFARENQETCMKRNSNRKGWCEKLYFFIRLFDIFNEFVLLDSDLLILKDELLDRLSIRSKANDFLATYAHSIMQYVPQRHHYWFNSGLLFIRRLPNVDYNEIERMWNSSKTHNDQHIITKFVFKRYENWDTLSWKWHCRRLERYKQDIPSSDCYTIHDRDEVGPVFKELNMTMLRIPTV